MKIFNRFTLNISSLFTISGLRFLISILTLPHLIKVYGPSNWGEIIFLQLIINYFIYFIDWSFSQYSSRLITITEKNKLEQDKIFQTTFNAQLILFLISIIILNIIFLFTKQKIYFISIIILLGNLLQPYWYLNGKERLYESAFFQLINKIFFCIFIIFAIKESSKISDYFLYMGLCSLLTGVLVFVRLVFHYKMVIKFININESLNLIKSSARLFTSEIYGSLSDSTIPLLVNSYLGSYDLGIYNIADRIKSLAIQVTHPISNSIFPIMNKNFENDKNKAYLLFHNLFSLSLTSLIIILFLLNVFINDIANFFSAEYASEVIGIIRILFISFTLNVLSSIFIIQYFIPNGLYAFLNNAKMLKFIFCIICTLLLITNFGIVGAAFSNLICELFITIILTNKFLKEKTKNISMHDLY